MTTVNYKAICETAIELAAHHGMTFSYKPEDIAGVEQILQKCFEDCTDGLIDRTQVWNAAVIWGIYLGQVMLDNALAAHGYCWKVEDGLPMLVKDGENKMSPITKAEKRILNGPEDSVESFYRIGLFIAEGRLNTMRKQQPPQEN